MTNSCDIQKKQAILNKCNSSHIILYVSYVEKVFLALGKFDYVFDTYAKCPISGSLFRSYNGKRIPGRELHYVNDGGMDYKFKRCSPTEVGIRYETWDEIVQILATTYNVSDIEYLKEMIRSNFPTAKFDGEVVENNKVKKKFLFPNFAK